jgi:hypothetical protein
VFRRQIFRAVFWEHVFRAVCMQLGMHKLTAGCGT